jgi:hypothetical protein
MHCGRRLERLCRYVARPPLALERLEAMPDGRLAYRLKTRWRDGTTHVLMERRELLERLAPLIPPPRAHQVRYHGLLAPCASGRDRVVPGTAVETTGSPAGSAAANHRQDHPGQAGHEARTSHEDRPAVRAQPAAAPSTSSSITSNIDRPSPVPAPAACDPPTSTTTPPPHPGLRPHRRHPWAELLQRIFQVDALCCPSCGGRMRILSAITDAGVARRILECLALPSRAPPMVPARAWPEPMPNALGGTALPPPGAFDFDQSTPEGWDDGA